MTTSIFHLRAFNAMNDDGMHLVTRIQEEFCIQFADAELAHIATVGELYAIVLSKLETGDSCRTSQAFYRLRKAMMALLNRPRKSIRPGTQLAALLPEAKRRVLWRQLENATRLTFPKLRHPRWARDVIRSLALASAVAFQLFMNWRTHPHGALWIPLEFAVLVVFVIVRQSLFAATAFLGIGLPVRTVGELTKVLLSTNFSQFTPEAGNELPYSRTEVWDQLAAIFVDELLMDPSKITPESRFEDDLNRS